MKKTYTVVAHTRPDSEVVRIKNIVELLPDFNYTFLELLWFIQSSNKGLRDIMIKSGLFSRVMEVEEIQ